MSILKQKKIISSLLLVFVLMGFFLPIKTVLASPEGQNCTRGSFSDSCPSGYYCLTSSYVPFTLSPGKCKAEWTNASGKVVAKIENIGDSIVSALVFLPLTASAIFSWVASESLRLVLKFSTETISYTSLNPAVDIGWPIVRNFANMIVVLALIIIALATILRYQEYEAKKLLPNLIIVALLINFSLVICGVVIDTSNITMVSLLKGKQRVDNRGAFLYSGSPLEDAVSVKIGKEEPTSDFLIRVSGHVFFFMARGVVAIIFAILFLFRIIALWILVMLSPLAFACYVLPATKKVVFDPWREAFIQWCFIGISAAIFIYIGDQMVNVYSPLNTTQTSVDILKKIMGFALPGMFMVLGFIFSLKISAMGSGMAISAGRYVKDRTIGAVKGATAATGGYLANKAGLTRAKEATVGLATRTGERLGLVAKGTAALQQQERLKKNNAEKETAALDTEGRKKVALGQAQGLSGGPILTEKARVRRAEAIRQVFKNKEEKNYTAEQRKEMAEFAKKMGIPTSVLTENNPDLLIPQDTRKSGSIRSALKKVPVLGRLARRTGERGAKQSLMLQEKAKLEAAGNSPKDVNRLLKSYENSLSSVDIRVAQQKLRAEKVRERALGYGPTNSQQIKEKAVDNEIERNKATWKIDIATKNPSLGADAQELLLQDRIAKAKKELPRIFTPSTSDFLKAKQDLAKEKIKKALGKLSPSKAAELPKEAVDAQTLTALSNNQLEQIGKRGGPSLVDEIKKYKFDPAKAPADQSKEYQDLKAYYKTLPKGSPEAIRCAEIIYKISKNSNFK